jgi:hypothetical protein
MTIYPPGTAGDAVSSATFYPAQQLDDDLPPLAGDSAIITRSRSIEQFSSLK